MAYTIWADSAHARLVAACYGPGSRAQCIQALHELGEQQREHPAWSVLIDARRFAWTARPEDLQAIRACVRADLHPGEPVAILSGPGVHYGAARQVAMWLQLDGLTVQAFQQELEAEAWLRAISGRSPSEDGLRHPFLPKG